MADLNPIEQMIVKALQELGATDENKMKTADDIAKKTNRPKGQITNTLVLLVQKGVIDRKAREKAAGYYLKK
ncbi:transcriptional regulator [Candidatus Micrarchaeota archaeon]|nr:transcriptional regulator [Candidatus Micrarchaeota archaeon]